MCANSLFAQSFMYAAPTLWNILDLVGITYGRSTSVSKVGRKAGKNRFNETERKKGYVQIKNMSKE